MSEPNEWRETVRDLYDKLHFGPDNIFTGNRLAMGIVAFIEERHQGFFTSPRDAERCSHEWVAVTAPNGDRGYQCPRCKLTRITLP